MNADAVIRLLREGLLMILVLSAAPLLTALVVSFVMTILQAVFNIQEQSLTFVPKLITVFATLAILGPWMIAQAVRFTHLMLEAIPLIR